MRAPVRKKFSTFRPICDNCELAKKVGFPGCRPCLESDPVLSKNLPVPFEDPAPSSKNLSTPFGVWTKGRFPFLKELPGFSGLGEELRLIYEFEERGGEAFPELKGAVRKRRRDGIKALIRQMDAADHDLEYGRANTTDYSVALARVRTFNSEEQGARPIPTLWNAVKSAPVVEVRRPRFAGPARVSTMPALPEIPKDYPEGWDFQPATDGVGYRFSTDDYEYTITSDDHKYRFGIARAELDGLQFTMDPAVGKRVKKEKKAGLPPLDERRRKNARIIVPMAVIDPGSHAQTPDQIKALYDERRSQIASTPL
jgi:hypothetical protein